MNSIWTDQASIFIPGWLKKPIAWNSIKFLASGVPTRSFYELIKFSRVLHIDLLLNVLQSLYHSYDLCTLYFLHCSLWSHEQKQPDALTTYFFVRPLFSVFRTKFPTQAELTHTIPSIWAESNVILLDRKMRGEFTQNIPPGVDWIYKSEDAAVNFPKPNTEYTRPLRAVL